MVCWERLHLPHPFFLLPSHPQVPLWPTWLPGRSHWLSWGQDSTLCCVCLGDSIHCPSLGPNFPCCQTGKGMAVSPRDADRLCVGW